MENKKAVIWNIRVYKAIRFHQISVFNDLKKIYQKTVAKDVEIEKCTCKIFCFDYHM